MKKTITFLFLLFLMMSAALSTFAYPQIENRTGDDESFGIADGYVRVREVYKDDEDNTLIVTRSYDKKGSLLKEVVREDNQITIRAYAYNKVGQETKRVYKTIFEDKTTYKITTRTSYNKAGKVAKEISNYDDCEDVIVYYYNKASQPTKEVRVKAYKDGTQDKTTTTYTYDKNGNEIKVVEIEKDRYGDIEKRIYTWKYNEKNLCVKDTQKYFYVADGCIEESVDTSSYTYDKNGNIIKEVFITTYEDGSKRRVVFSRDFDDTGRIIKMAIIEKSLDCNSKTSKAFAYDKKGRLLMETTIKKIASGKEKTIETYTYDKVGNLTKYVMSGGKGKSVTTYDYNKIKA